MTLLPTSHWMGELPVRTALMMRKTRLAHRPEGCRVYFTRLLS